MKIRRMVGILLLAMLLTSIFAIAAPEQTVYTGSAHGFASPVTAEVTLEDGTVVGLTVDDSGESYPTAGISRKDSVDKLVQAILAAGSTEGVDASTGATFTSQAVLTVVNEALAGGAPRSVAEITYTPGTYIGTADGRDGDITVEVTVSEKAIESITVTDASLESVRISDMPLEKIPQDIVA